MLIVSWKSKIIRVLSWKHRLFIAWSRDPSAASVWFIFNAFIKLFKITCQNIETVISITKMSRNPFKNEPRKNYKLNQHELREVKRISKQISAKMRRMSAERYPENICTKKFNFFFFRLSSHFRFIACIFEFLYYVWTRILKKLNNLLPNRPPKRGLGGSKLKTL